MIPNSKKIYLCRPDQEKINVLNGVQTSSVDFHPQVKGYSELSFTVDRFISINGRLVESNNYEDLRPHMWLYLEDIGYFIMEPPTTSFDGNQEQKQIVAYSAEKEFEYRDWVGIKINCGTSDSLEYANTDESNKDEQGFAIRYITMINEDPNLSFLNLILQKMSSRWTIQYISPSLRDARIPWLEVDSENLYAVLTSEVGPRMSCLFVFDYLNFGINVYDKNDLNFDTGIYIGFRNLEKSVNIGVNNDSIYTRFTVRGDGDLEFRDVNYGDNTVINLDYFLDEPYMDSETADKYIAWKEFRDKYREAYIEMVKQQLQLNEKLKDRIYRVPSDESYWKNWQGINEEGLRENYNYFLKQLETLQISVDDRSPNEMFDSSNNYLPKQTQGRQAEVRALLNQYESGVFGNIDLAHRQTFVWDAENMQHYSRQAKEYGVSLGEVSTVLGSWDNKFYVYVKGQKLNLSVAYSPILQDPRGPDVLERSFVENYIFDLLDQSLDTDGNFSISTALAKDRTGIYYGDLRVFGLIAGISENTSLTKNPVGIISEIMHLSEEGSHREAINKILSLANLSLSNIPNIGNSINKTVLLNATYDYLNNNDLVDHEWYLQQLYDQVNIYGGYYTYSEILKYILPNIMLALENLGELDENKTEPDLSIANDWSLYGLKELEGVRDSYKDKMKALDTYSKNWGDMTEAERKEKGLNYVGDGSEQKYEETTGRIEYKKYARELGDENTPGTILYQIKILEDEIDDIEDQIEQINKTTHEYAVIMNYAVTEEELDGLEILSPEMIEERRPDVYDGRELLTIMSLLKDTDYVNSNILATSIFSVDEHIQAERDLLADADDKLYEISQPQYTFSVSMDNFFRLSEYREWADEFGPNYGAPPIGMLKFIRVGLRDDYTVKLRVIGYRWNPCEITPDLSIDFSNMVTSRSGRSDLTELLDTENNRGSKNQIRIGNGSAESAQEYATALMELLQNNSIFLKSVQNIAGGTTGNVDAGQVQSIISAYMAGYAPEINGTISVNNISDLSAEFENLFSQYVGADVIAGKVIESDQIFTNQATINEVLRVGTNQITEIANGTITTATINVKQLYGEKGDFEELTADIIEAGYGEFEQLVAENSYIRNLVGDTAEFNSFMAQYIKGENAEFDNLLAGHITADSIGARFAEIGEGHFDSLFANDAFINHLLTSTSATITSVVDSQYVSNLIAGTITAETLFGGRIVLSDDMEIVSENGALKMNGDVLQFGRINEDEEYEVGIQIGYGNDARPSLIIRDDDGTVLFTSQGIIGDNGEPVMKGISAEAIANGLIVNDMVGEGSLHLDRLSEPIVRANEHGGIDITQIYDGSGNQFGVTWTSFKNEVMSALDNVNTSVPVVELTGRQVYIERNGVITPPLTDILITTKNGAVITELTVNGIKVATGSDGKIDLETLQLDTSKVFEKADIAVVKAITEDPMIYDTMTLYKIVEGSPKYTVVISSSEGYLFTEETQTICTCDVYYGSELVEPNSYEWIMLNDNQTEWQVVGNEKTLNIDMNDNSIKRRLKCRIDV